MEGDVGLVAQDLLVERLEGTNGFGGTIRNFWVAAGLNLTSLTTCDGAMGEASWTADAVAGLSSLIGALASEG